MNHDKRETPSDSPDSWRSLVLFFRQARVALLPTWHYKINPEGNFDPEMKRWMAFEIPYRGDIDLMVGQWVDGKAVPFPSEQHAYLFCARLGAISELMEFFSYSENGTWVSPFPFPEMDRERLLRVLLINWWAGSGWSLAFERIFTAKRGT